MGKIAQLVLRYKVLPSTLEDRNLGDYVVDVVEDSISQGRV